MVRQNKKITLSPSNEFALFKANRLLQDIGNDEHFHEKLWILIKGIKSGTGESILINSLGHSPCHAMLKEQMPYGHILSNLDYLEKHHLIEFPDPNSIKSMRTFVVTGNTAYDLNQLLFNHNLMEFLGESDECYKILKKLGFNFFESSVKNTLIQKGKKSWDYLNDANGIATSNLFKTFVWNNLPETVKFIKDNLS